MLGQCWANVVLPTPTIGQPYYPIPTLAQHSHAIWAVPFILSGLLPAEGLALALFGNIARLDANSIEKTPRIKATDYEKHQQWKLVLRRQEDMYQV